MSRQSNYQRIYEVVRKIPQGRVATYGQVARLAGLGGHARQVGYALHNLPENSGIPWQRVINARGEISFPSDSPHWYLQRALLEAEGIRFDANDKVSLGRYRWKAILDR
ncbi:MAG: MGMT family protein [Calditrichota bacterium]|jgi:methylated-DNA-protein-cysteine methyltransferase-like protein